MVQVRPIALAGGKRSLGRPGVGSMLLRPSGSASSDASDCVSLTFGLILLLGFGHGLIEAVDSGPGAPLIAVALLRMTGLLGLLYPRRGRLPLLMAGVLGEVVDVLMLASVGGVGEEATSARLLRAIGAALVISVGYCWSALRGSPGELVAGRAARAGATPRPFGFRLVRSVSVAAALALVVWAVVQLLVGRLM